MDIASVVSNAKKVIDDAKNAAGATLAKVARAPGRLTASAPTIFDRLEADHAEFRQLMKRLAETTPRATKQRQRLFERLRAVVTAHARAEEAVLYAALKAVKKTRPEVLEGHEEHHLCDVIFAEMAKLPPSDERWGAKLAVLKESLGHHIDEEERELFEDARKALPRDQEVALGHAFAADKARRLAAAARRRGPTTPR